MKVFAITTAMVAVWYIGLRVLQAWADQMDIPPIHEG